MDERVVERDRSDVILTKAETPAPSGGMITITGHGWQDEPVKLFAVPLPNAPAGFPCEIEPERTPLSGGIPVEVLQQHRYALTVRVPSDEFAVTAVYPDGNASLARSVVVNRAQLNWVSSDRAEPGEVLRAFGRALVSLDLYPARDRDGNPVSFAGDVEGGTSVAVVDSSGGRHSADVIRMSSYDVEFRLPEGLPEGIATVHLHNGCGGEFGWSEPVEVRIERTRAWPDNVVSVKDFGATGDGFTDDTPALERTLEAVRTSGGGTAYFPPGSYFFRRTLRVPPNTVLRGAGRERSWLFMPDGIVGMTEYARDDSAKIGIAGEGPLGLKDLSIHAVYPSLLVAAPVGRSLPDGWIEFKEDGEARSLNADGSFIRNCRLLHNFTHLYHRRPDDPAFEKRIGVGEGSIHHRCAAFAFSGRYLEIANSQFQGRGTCGSLANCSYSRVSGNTFHAGAAGNALNLQSSGRNPKGYGKIIIEDNVMDGAANTHHSALFMMHGGTDIFIARNEVVRQFWVSDSEGLLAHMWGYRIPVYVAAGDGNSVVADSGRMKRFSDESSGGERQEWTEWPIRYEDGRYDLAPFVGHEVRIFDGPGLGLTNRIRAVEGERVSFEKPWSTPPTPRSLLVVHQFPAYRNLIFADNVLQDTGPSIFLWGHAHDSVIDGNRVTRSGFIGACCVPVGGWAAGGCHFVQIINNVMDEGRVHTLDRFTSTSGRYARGYIAVFYNAFDNFRKGDGLSFLGFVVRNNLLKNDCTIGFNSDRIKGDIIPDEGTEKGRGTERIGIEIGECNRPYDHVSFVIERNTIENSAYGMYFGDTVMAALGENVFLNVEHPVTGEEHSGIRIVE